MGRPLHSLLVRTCLLALVTLEVLLLLLCVPRRYLLCECRTRPHDDVGIVGALPGAEHDDGSYSRLRDADGESTAIQEARSIYREARRSLRRTPTLLPSPSQLPPPSPPHTQGQQHATSASSKRTRSPGGQHTPENGPPSVRYAPVACGLVYSGSSQRRIAVSTELDDYAPDASAVEPLVGARLHSAAGLMHAATAGQPKLAGTVNAHISWAVVRALALGCPLLGALLVLAVVVPMEISALAPREALGWEHSPPPPPAPPPLKCSLPAVIDSDVIDSDVILVVALPILLLLLFGVPVACVAARLLLPAPVTRISAVPRLSLPPLASWSTLVNQCSPSHCSTSAYGAEPHRREGQGHRVDQQYHNPLDA